jgi:chorismate synthase
VAETMVALVLADEATRKFGGDSVAELRANHAAYVASL